MKKTSVKTRASVNGKLVASLGSSLVLVRVPGAKNAKVGTSVNKKHQASTVVKQVGRALNTPGLDRGAVFKYANSVAYFMDPADPRHVIQEAHDGTRKRGLVVKGKFKAIEA